MQPLTRTLDPGITYFSAAKIRVVLLPIGEIPDDVFEHYASLVMAHRQVELSNVRSFYKASQKSPFKFFPWKTGHMHFRFLPEDAASPPSPLSTLHNHRRVLGVLGIMSCAHDPDVARRYKDFESRCRAFPDAATVRCLAFDPPTDDAGLPVPAAAEDARSRPDLILFPPGQDADHLGNHLEVVMHDFAACVLGSLEAWMLNASPAAASLSTLIDTPEFTGQAVAPYAGEDDAGRTKRKYARVQKAMGDYSLLAGSPLDAVDHYNTAAELGRAAADWTVAAAAMEGYGAAKLLHAAVEGEAFVTREDSVFRDDRAWREPRRSSETATPREEGSDAANAQEVTETETRTEEDTLTHEKEGEEGAEDDETAPDASDELGAPFDSQQFWAALRRASGLEEEVRLLVDEAKAAIRRRGGLPLLVEADLRWARLLAGLHGSGARGEVTELANAVQHAAELLPLPEDRLVALTEAAAVLGGVGASRKRVLLMWQAVELSKYFGFPDTRTLEVARAALEPAARGNGGASAWPAPRRPLAQDTAVPASWGPVRAGCLEATLGLAIYAKRHGDVWDAAAALLRDHAPLLSQHRMQSLMDNMAAAASQMAPGERVRPGRGPPPLLLPGAPRPPPPPLAPLWIDDVGGAAPVISPSARHSVFLYDPFSAKRRQQRQASAAAGADGAPALPEWVAGEPGAVDIEVSNPTSVSIKIDKMVLEGVFLPADAPAGASPSPAAKIAWKAKPVSLNIPAYTKPVRIQLEGTPLAPGTLTLTGCRLSAFGGVSWSQPWAGKPSPLAEQLTKAWKYPTAETNAVEGIKGMVVKVLPSLPRLELKLTAAGETLPSLRLLQGQPIDTELMLTNVGSLAIDTLRVDIGSASGSGGAAPGRPGAAGASTSKLIVDVDAAHLEAALPLASGASVALPVRFSAPAAGGTSESLTESLAVEYASGHIPAPSYAAAVAEGSPMAPRQIPGRRAALNVSVAVAPSLLLSRVDFEPVYVPDGAGECVAHVLMTAEVVNRGRQPLEARLGPTAAAAATGRGERDGEAGSPAAVGPGQRAKLTYLLAAGDGAALSVEEEDEKSAGAAPLAAAPRGAGRRPSGPVRYEERERQGCAAAVAHRVCLHFIEPPSNSSSSGGDASSNGSGGPLALKPPGQLPLVHGEVYNGLTPATLCMLRPCAVAVRLMIEPLDAPTADSDAQSVLLPVGSTPFVCPALRVSVGQPVRVVLEARSLVEHPLEAFCSLVCAPLAPLAPGEGVTASGAEPMSPVPASMSPVGASPVLAGLGAAQPGTVGAAWAGAHSRLHLKLPPRGTVRHVAGVALAAPGVFRLGTGQVGLSYAGAAAVAGQEETASQGALGQNTLVNVEPAFVLVENS